MCRPASQGNKIRHNGSYPRGRGFLFSLIICGLAWSCSLAWGSPSLQLFSDPPSLNADSQTTAIITAQVEDDGGAPASDGTVVTFSTTLGKITPAGETRGGVARAVLTSGAVAGTAIVSALSGGGRTDIEVEFIGSGGESRPTTALLYLTGNDLIYYRDSRLVLSNCGGRFEYGGITIMADCLQCDLNEIRIMGQGAVTVSNGKEVLTGDAVVFQARKGQGSLLRYESETANISGFLAPNLKLSKDSTTQVEGFQPLRPQSERNLVRAKRIRARADGKLLFNDAVMQLDGVDLMKLPQYVTEVNGGEAAFADQIFGMNKSVGLTADFPYYYDANPNHIGCLRLTHNLTADGALQERGWGMNLEEQYWLSEKSHGSLSLDSITESYRGFRWSHNQKLSAGSDLSASVSSTQFDGNSDRVFDAGATLSQRIAGLSLGLALRASKYANSEVYTAGLSAVTPRKAIGSSKYTYNTGIKVNYGRAKSVTADYSEEDGFFQLTSTDTANDWLSEGIYLYLYAPKAEIGKRASITSRVSLSNSWQESSMSQALSANSGLNYKINDKSSLRLSYSASLCQSDALSHSQNLNFNVNYIRPGSLESSGFASYNVESNRFSGSAGFSYYPNFQRTVDGEPQWVITCSGLVNRWGSSSYNESKISLGRGLGNWQVSLNFSPQGTESDSGVVCGSSGLTGASGYGYTQELGRTFWVEFSPRTF